VVRYTQKIISQQTSQKHKAHKTSAPAHKPLHQSKTSEMKLNLLTGVRYLGQCAKMIPNLINPPLVPVDLGTAGDRHPRKVRRFNCASSAITGDIGVSPIAATRHYQPA
jgi:hypothetical protein